MELLDVRFGELLTPQEFIRLDTVIQELSKEALGKAEPEAIHYLWDFVCRNVKYPETTNDLHVLNAFPIATAPFVGTRYEVKRSTDSFWQYGGETLAWSVGNCIDCSILLCSLLQAYGIPPDRVDVVVGEVIRGTGHAWVELDGNILETTLTKAPNPSWRDYHEYDRYWKFNSQQVVGNIVVLPKGDEARSQARIAQLWQYPVKLKAASQYRYSELPEQCVCKNCGFVAEAPGVHCREIEQCPSCGSYWSMWRTV